jgi:AraC family transcriptional regulator
MRPERFPALGENCYVWAMSQTALAQKSEPSSRHIAGGDGWSLYEFVCHAGPQDRPFEERHGGVSIAAVVAGSFTYASDTGRALLHPGALLLGNHGACYSCGHEHSTGDRCVSVQFTPDYFGEIAASAAGSSRFRFPTAMLPARRSTLAGTVLIEARSRMRDPLDMEEQIVRFIAAAVRTLSGQTAISQRVSAQDARRVSRVLRHIEAHSAEPLDLERLASIAATSKFHFLRIFRRAVGLTPYQFLLNTRLRQAALRLLATPDAVSAIAYDTGFGDLSTFNAAFRDRFGAAPLAFRRSAMH